VSTMKAEQFDPWGNPYGYRYPPSKNKGQPDIWSFGPDMIDGTEDDIGNWEPVRGLSEGETMLKLEGEKVILHKIRGSWGMSKEACFESLIQNVPEQLAVIAKKKYTEQADVIFDKLVYEFKDDRVKLYSLENSWEDTIKILSADATTGEFVFSRSGRDDRSAEMKGKVSGDEMILDEVNLIRLAEEESERRKEAIKDFDQFTNPVLKDQARRAAQNRELQFMMGLSKAVIHGYAPYHDGNFPARLDELGDDWGHTMEIKNMQTGDEAEPLYLGGQNVESPADQILIASPWVWDGRRAVVYCDSSGKIMKEDRFQEEFAKTLESVARSGARDGEPIQPTQEESIAAIEKVGGSFGDDGKTLELSHARISDAGLAHLQGMAGLERLGLSHTRISDAGLLHLKGMTNLVLLSLNNTKITDAGLAHLQGLTGLKRLNLSGTKVTDAGVKKLQAALPKCKISH
jgi:hypothetical protein